MPIALPPSRHLSLSPTSFCGRTANQARDRGRFVSVPSTTRTSHQARRRLTATQRASLPDRERTVCEVFNVFAVEGDRADFIPINVNCGPLVEVLALVLPKKHSVSKRAVIALCKSAYLQQRSIKDLPRRTVRRNSIVKQNAKVLARRRLPNFESADVKAAVKRLLVKLRRQGKLRDGSIDGLLGYVQTILSTYDRFSHTYSYYPPLQSDASSHAHPSTSRSLQLAVRPQSNNVYRHYMSTAAIPKEGQPSVDDDVYAERVVSTVLSESDFLSLKIMLSEKVTVISIARVWKARQSWDVLSNRPLTHLESSLLSICMEEDLSKRAALRNDFHGSLRALIEIRRSRQLPLFEDDRFWPSGTDRASYN